MMRHRFLSLGLIALGTWFVYGCGGGDGTGSPGAGGDGNGTGSTAGSGGAGGPGGAGGSGGTSGSAGRGGGAGSAATAGTTGTGGAAGRGGATGTGGAAGRGGTGGGTGGGTSSGPSCTWPTPASTVTLSATQTVTNYDGTMRRFVGTGPLGTSGQNEDQGPLFNVTDGGTLQNVILGNPAADGVHCEGTCTLKNVWWEDVGEDAATLQGSSQSQVMTIDGGGARAASDKVFQHNGPGTMIIKNLCVQDFGKLYRSCGNCNMQYARHVEVQNIIAIPGSGTSALVGVNANYNDTAKFSAITVRARSNGITICQRYNGNNTGAEPTSAGSGADGTVCMYSASDITWMP